MNAGGRRSLYLGLAAAAALAALPAAGPAYYLQLLTIVFYWIGLAACWNLMCGYTGYIDFGSAAYTGIGAYVAGLLMLRLGLPLMAAAPLAGLGAGLVALAVGWPTLRLRGAYFAIATFALAEALMQVCEEWSGLTEGGVGITIPQRLAELSYYWLYLGLAGLVVGLTWWVEHHKHGYGLKAIHQDEQAAAQVGVNTHLVKLQTYVTSAFFIGILGALEGSRLGYFKPDDVFNVHITIKMVIMSLLGGMGTVLGPVIGASFLQLVEDFLGARFLNYYLVIIGAIIVGVIIFLPRGIAGSLGQRLGWRPWRRR
ncbi:MAG: branched-chain amino acid ABC transporter permease [Thermodesulfobacteriota bacterium]